MSHDSYLINLGSPDAELWKKSIDAFVVELQRAELLGIPYVVMHPGSYTTSTEAQGIKRIVSALNEVHQQTKGIGAKCLLENTAGQGSNLGWKFEHLAAILEGVKDPERLGGVCIDTCHLFAAGHAIGTKKEYLATMRALDRAVGLARVKAFHLNDSKARFGSRVDRHAHIGRGEIGIEAFRLLLNDRRFRRVPMYLETRKGVEKGVDLDVINLKTLRRLVGRDEDEARRSTMARWHDGHDGGFSNRIGRRGCGGGAREFNRNKKARQVAAKPIGIPFFFTSAHSASFAVKIPFFFFRRARRVVVVNLWPGMCNGLKSG